jgi:hypothetical protein
LDGTGIFPVLLLTGLEIFEQGFLDAVSVFIPMFLGMIGVVTAFVIIILLIGVGFCAEKKYKCKKNRLRMTVFFTFMKHIS